MTRLKRNSHRNVPYFVLRKSTLNIVNRHNGREPPQRPLRQLRMTPKVLYPAMPRPAVEPLPAAVQALEARRAVVKGAVQAGRSKATHSARRDHEAFARKQQHESWGAATTEEAGFEHATTHQRSLRDPRPESRDSLSKGRGWSPSRRHTEFVKATGLQIRASGRRRGRRKQTATPTLSELGRRRRVGRLEVLVLVDLVEPLRLHDQDRSVPWNPAAAARERGSGGAVQAGL